MTNVQEGARRACGKRETRSRLKKKKRRSSWVSAKLGGFSGKEKFESVDRGETSDTPRELLKAIGRSPFRKGTTKRLLLVKKKRGGK